MEVDGCRGGIGERERGGRLYMQRISMQSLGIETGPKKVCLLIFRAQGIALHSFYRSALFRFVPFSQLSLVEEVFRRGCIFGIGCFCFALLLPCACE